MALPGTRDDTSLRRASDDESAATRSAPGSAEGDAGTGVANAAGVTSGEAILEVQHWHAHSLTRWAGEAEQVRR